MLLRISADVFADVTRSSAKDIKNKLQCKTDIWTTELRMVLSLLLFFIFYLWLKMTLHDEQSEKMCQYRTALFETNKRTKEDKTIRFDNNSIENTVRCWTFRFSFSLHAEFYTEVILYGRIRCRRTFLDIAVCLTIARETHTQKQTLENIKFVKPLHIKLLMRCCFSMGNRIW